MAIFTTNPGAKRPCCRPFSTWYRGRGRVEDRGEGISGDG
jgi:hypothetical protein